MAENERNGEAKRNERQRVRVCSSDHRFSAFREMYGKAPEPRQPLLETARDKLGQALQCNKDRTKKICLSVFPFVRIMRKYDVKNDLVNDVIAGLTVGIMQLPQGMAYAMLAQLPPVVGLYMSFFPVLVYFFLGTSKQVSIGTVAVISLMTGGVVAKEAGLWEQSRNNAATAGNDVAPMTIVTAATSLLPNSTAGWAETAESEQLDAYKISIATTVAFITGLAQIGMGLCRVGFVTTYMGDSLVSGFTTGAAVHVFTSQVKFALGLRIPRFENLFQIVQTYKAIFENLPKTNIAELVITVICILVLYLVKDHVNQRIKGKCRIPIPIELIVVVVGTLASYYGSFRQKWGIRTVGHIPAGLPRPGYPTFENVSNYGFECVVIGVIAFAQSISLAVLMAKKHHYEIDANKELIAYGAGTLFGSFFSCYPMAASVSRSSVQDSAGGRTQLANVFSAGLVLVVILFIGPLFHDLPNCCLSAIIMVALKSMFLQVLELKKMYRVSPYDCAIWIATFLSVVMVSVEYGLYIGIVFSFFTIVMRSQITSVKTVEDVGNTGNYRSIDIYTKTEEKCGIKVVAYNSPLHYANGELFLSNVYKATEVKPEKMRKILKRIQMKTVQHSTADLIVDESMVIELEPVGDHSAHCHAGGDNGKTGSTLESKDPRSFRHLVIDFTAMPFIDPQGIKVLKQLIEEYKGVGITVYIAGLRDEVWRTLECAEFTKKYDANIYLTVNDAVESAAALMSSEVPVADLERRKENQDPEATAETELLTTVRT